MDDYESSDDEDISIDDSSAESGADVSESESEESEQDDNFGVISDFKSQMSNLLLSKFFASKLKISGSDDNDKEIVDQYISEAVTIIKNFDRLENLNINLLVLAAGFNILYKTKDKVNEKNITEFIKETDAEPIDVIRYITMYQNNKSS